MDNVFDLEDATSYAGNADALRVRDPQARTRQAVMSVGLPGTECVAVEVMDDGIRLVHLAPSEEVGRLGEVTEFIPLTAEQAYGFRLAYRLQKQRNENLSEPMSNLDLAADSVAILRAALADDRNRMSTIIDAWTSTPDEAQRFILVMTLTATMFLLELSEHGFDPESVLDRGAMAVLAAAASGADPAEEEA